MLMIPMTRTRMKVKILLVFFCQVMSFNMHPSVQTKQLLRSVISRKICLMIVTMIVVKTTKILRITNGGLKEVVLVTCCSLLGFLQQASVAVPAVHRPHHSLVLVNAAATATVSGHSNSAITTAKLVLDCLTDYRLLSFNMSTQLNILQSTSAWRHSSTGCRLVVPEDT